MNFSWKLYRKKFSEGFVDAKTRESLFVLGLDIGNTASSIAFFDINRMTPETVDVSGGYGKPCMPTALQYIKESKEWVYGDYALLNRGLSGDALYLSLMEKLTKKEYLDVDGKPYTAESVLSIFLKELLANCKNINPKAEIAGTVLAAPSYVPEETKNGIAQVFKQAGFDKSLIAIDSDRECIFSYYFHNNPIKSERVVLLDYGGRELRGGIYDIEPGEPARIVSVSSLFDKSGGTDGIDHHVVSMLTDHYCSQTGTPYAKLEWRVSEQIAAFAYQHKDLLFQQNISSRPVKLYYNFVYPPIVYTATGQAMDEFIKPYRDSFNSFLERLFAKSIGGRIGKDTVDAVICTGGGFEMLWARSAVNAFFHGAKILVSKNPKSIVAEGASVRAAEALLVKNPNAFFIEDIHKLNVDVGVGVLAKTQNLKRPRFLPIVERNTFWWQEHDPVSFIFTGGDAITLYSRNDAGELTVLGHIPLVGLPARPPGATRLNMWLEFKTHNVLSVTVRDMGFGEMFPFSDFHSRADFKMIGG